MLKKIILILLVLQIISCSGDDHDTSTQENELIQPENPIAKGDRLFGVFPQETSLGFNHSLEFLKQTGTQMVELNLEWSYFEKTEGIYEDPFDILNSIGVYGLHNTKLGLSIATINTVRRTDPSYLNNTSYDDPEYISAFNNLIDYIMANKAENVEISYISVGNEVDVVLDGTDWVSFKNFTSQAKDHIHTNYSGILVGAKTTVFGGILGSEKTETLDLISVCDVAMLNYYPQDSNFQVLDPSLVKNHLQEINALITDKTIYFTEVGYQSGNLNNSSESKQALFFHEFFKSWDIYRDKIKLAHIDWLHDISPESLNKFEEYYQISDPGFLSFLSSLGVRTANNDDKIAWKQILLETKERGW